MNNQQFRKNTGFINRTFYGITFRCCNRSGKKRRNSSYYVGDIMKDDYYLKHTHIHFNFQRKGLKIISWDEFQKHVDTLTAS